MTSSAPLVRIRLSEQILQRLRDELRAGSIASGEHLTEMNVAARYGVSRTPVRETLIRLHQEGLLVAGERGYHVPMPSARALLDRLEVRELLERHIARNVARYATAEDIARLGCLIDAQAAACDCDDPDPFVAANLAFRRLLRALCGNAVLEGAAATIDDQFQLMRAALQRPPAARQLTLAHNRVILAAIAKGDAEAAMDGVSAFVSVLRDQVPED